MTKAELMDKVAATLQWPRPQTDTVITLFWQCIMDALGAGDHVEWRSFGNFRLRDRPPRTGRNPKTGETVQIPATQVPWFTAEKALRALVNTPPAIRDHPAGPAAHRPRARVRRA